MENQLVPVSKFKFSSQYGLITGGIMIVFSLLISLLVNDPATKLNYLAYAFLAGGMIYSALSFRNLQGYSTYSQSFSIMFFTGLISIVILSVYQFVYFKYIDPEMIDKMLVMAEEQLYQRNMPDDQIDTALEMQKRFMTPGLISIMTFIYNIIAVVVLGVIFSIFTKKNESIA
ncbi:MAG: DUF4199 domain-containing protein [Bacteroidales bacterium]|nr:DUF4199 domain-containing protein [Bacteroidales bacterium]